MSLPKEQVNSQIEPHVITIVPFLILLTCRQMTIDRDHNLFFFFFKLFNKHFVYILLAPMLGKLVHLDVKMAYHDCVGQRLLCRNEIYNNHVRM